MASKLLASRLRSTEKWLKFDSSVVAQSKTTSWPKVEALNEVRVTGRGEPELSGLGTTRMKSLPLLFVLSLVLSLVLFILSLLLLLF